MPVPYITILLLHFRDRKYDKFLQIVHVFLYPYTLKKRIEDRYASAAYILKTYFYIKNRLDKHKYLTMIVQSTYTFLR